MSEDLWMRPKWQDGGGKPYLLYVVYGLTEISGEINARAYRMRGIPEGVEVHAFTREEHGDYLRESFEEGEVWEMFAERDPELARRVLASPGAISFIGEVEDDRDLLYLRDVIGMIACLVDQGAVAVYEPFTLRWWKADEWKERYFAGDAFEADKHVMIYYSEEEDGLWLHSRGMSTFGRPDLSVHGIARPDFKAAASMCNQLIEFQARGGIVPEGLRVRHPLGVFTAHHRGDADDPEFNNSHIELIAVNAAG